MVYTRCLSRATGAEEGSSKGQNHGSSVFAKSFVMLSGLKPSVVISEFESQPRSRFPRQHLSRKSQFLQDNSRQITIFSRTSHKTEAPNHSLDYTFWRVGDSTCPEITPPTQHLSCWTLPVFVPTPFPLWLLIAILSLIN